MPFASRRADLLERALQGGHCADPEVRDLVGTAGRIPALTAPACTPAPEFVTDLGLRLRAEALTLPAREVPRVPAGSHAKAYRRSGSPVRPRVLVLGKGLPRALAAGTAALLVVGAVVGGTSRSALPGGLFYPVKQVLDSAAVRLAGSDFDRGVTWLSQAQEHISDARGLVRRDGAQSDPASVDQALVSAYGAVGDGQRALLGEFDRTGNAQALIATQDFAVRALPQLSALRPLVPAASRPAVDALTALLEQTRTTLARKIAVCGQPCASPSSAPVTDLPNARGRVVPGLPTARGLPGNPTVGITAPGGVVVGPGGSPLRVPARPRGADLPPVTVASITVSPPPVVIAPPKPPLLPTVTTVLPAPTAGLPLLP